ncbi:MAG: transcription elongation factor GreA [Clostridiales bacterium]|jgi:transcription elongation factor GreA|nr:MAG: transcription elongation factor GreA [Clostridiales bacterium]
MHDELTRTDIEKMKEELHQRRTVTRPQLLEAVKEARAFGDLSENFEYKAAKREKNQNESRIRYLENMIKTAVVISDHSGAGEIGLFDKVTVLFEEDDETEQFQLVTTLRQDSLHGLISKESPVGKALLGRRAGDRVTVRVSDSYSYPLRILAVEKGADDGSIPISPF